MNAAVEGSMGLGETDGESEEGLLQLDPTATSGVWILASVGLMTMALLAEEPTVAAAAVPRTRPSGNPLAQRGRFWVKGILAPDWKASARRAEVSVSLMTLMNQSVGFL